MTRKKRTTQNRTPSATRDTDTLLDALRLNMSLLGELAMRYQVEVQPDRPAQDPPHISSPGDVRRLLGPEMASLAQEQLRVLLLDVKSRLVGQRVIYQGNAYSAIVRPAEVLRPAVVEAVPQVIIVHNHPSNEPTPSPEDIAITAKLVHAAKLLDIDLLDHVVIGGDRAASLKELGYIPA